MGRMPLVADSEAAGAVFSTPECQQVFFSVMKHLSVTAQEVEQELQLDPETVHRILKSLAKSDLITADAPNHGDIALYSPTLRGARLVGRLGQV